MTPFLKLERWSEQHHAPWMDVLRLILGSILMLKGFMFIMDTASLIKLLNELNFGENNVLIAHLIAIMHLFTGFMIFIGLATRAASLIQIPIILGAIFFVNLNGGERTGELILSIIVLLLLIFYFIKGSGKFSAYYYLINSKRSRLTDESKGDYRGGSSVAPMDKEANIL